jgi:deoxyadenosine/deoxycytidine kinase
MFRSLPDLECHFLDASYPVLLARLEARERDDIEELILDYIIDEHDRLDNLIGHYKAYCCYAYLMKKSDLIIVNGGD